MDSVRVTLTVRISYGIVYAVKAYISTPSTVIDEVDNALPPGSRLLMMDRYYDVEDAMEIYSQRGYIPLVKPNSGRNRGYHRRIYRRISDTIGDNYRHRGRGESVFRSLINQYGERLKNTSKTNSPHNKNTNKNKRSNK